MANDFNFDDTNSPRRNDADQSQHRRHSFSRPASTAFGAGFGWTMGVAAAVLVLGLISIMLTVGQEGCKAVDRSIDKQNGVERESKPKREQRNEPARKPETE